MSQLNLEQISQLLQLRGFITDEDITFSQDGIKNAEDIAGWACAREDKIRELGYTGGSLQGWATEFDRFGCAYGIVDYEWYDSSKYIEIERYLKVTESIKLCEDMTVFELKSYGLGLVFNCECGNESNIGPEFIKQNMDSKFLVDLKGSCNKCPRSGIAVHDIYKPWKLE
ncbi:hypothetical protein [Photobacterium swingsii]|uniref:hypothetical protein n=1 Tax=Photobacterium swingsii TaxID=680026 RepID=UPI004069856A